MSTPSPVPLDNFDPVSPYAPKWARDENDVPAEPQRPAGIENDHDARILDEIEASLRAMIATNHGNEEPVRLSEVSRAAAEEIAEREEQQQADEAAREEFAATQASEQQTDQPDTRQLAADMATVRDAFRDPRTPPWLLSRSLDPEPIPEPVDEHWPKPRSRTRTRSGRANKIFLRFGLAATGAAIVAAIAVKDLPAYVMNVVSGPIADLSTNAAAVFNEGKASSLQTRMDAVHKEQDRGSSGASLRYAVANEPPQQRPVPVKTEAIGRGSEPRRETVMTPWPSPDQAKRTEPANWQSTPAQPAAQSAVPSPQPPVQAAAPTPAPVAASNPADDAAARMLSAEEIAMLRKMGDDYISSGDFVGARAVLERAANAGDASAAFAIASTYDPIVLARFKVRGLEPDIVKAEFWYERARVLGSSEAPHRLKAMMASRAN
jgi:hypothetical protein